jgi:non-ribosomal peptide synthetase component F
MGFGSEKESARTSEQTERLIVALEVNTIALYDLRKALIQQDNVVEDVDNDTVLGLYLDGSAM